MSHLLQPSLSVQVTNPNCPWHPVLRWVSAFIQGKNGKRQKWIEFKYGLSEILQLWNILYQDCSWYCSLCRCPQSILPMHATRCHLIHGSLGAKDEVFLMGLAKADGGRKYEATLLRRILLCAICLLSPAPKGEQDIQLWEVFRAQLCPGSSSFVKHQEPEEWKILLASSGHPMFPGRFWMYGHWLFHELVWRNADPWNFPGRFAKGS